MTLRGTNISNIYNELCRLLTTDGDEVTVRGLSTRELTCTRLCLSDPRLRFVNFKARNMSMKYFVGELCYFLAGRTDLASIAYYSRFWEKVSDDGATVNSSYGARLFTLCGEDQIQFKYAIRCLEADKSSRKAVMAIYRPSDARDSKDNPCTMFLQLLIRNDRLHMFAFMRSNDVWLGTPYDVAFFTIVQEIACVLLRKTYPELKLGTYTHDVVSLHAYEKDWVNIEKLYTEGNHKQVTAPPIEVVDVETWFDDLLTYEKSTRGKVLYKNESKRSKFQDWCKNFLK